MVQLGLTTRQWGDHIARELVQRVTEVDRGLLAVWIESSVSMESL